MLIYHEISAILDYLRQNIMDDKKICVFLDI